MKHTLHVTALPHNTISWGDVFCAYSRKTLEFCEFMKELGYNVILYAAEGSDPSCCSELVQVMTTEEQKLLCDPCNKNKEMYKIDWDERKPYWQLYNSRTIVEMKKRIQPKDIICILGGVCHRSISDAFPTTLAVEHCIGYDGVYLPYKCFESHTHQSAVYKKLSNDPDGSYYDTVVPCYFKKSRYKVGNGSGNYLLYLGRIIQRKGVLVASETAKHAGMKLVIAGQGIREWHAEDHKLITEEGLTLEGDHIQYVGAADHDKKVKLMGNATAVLMPTTFIEPGGNVAIESQACGTPVITTDWGCLAQSVEHGLSGYRCHTLEQFVWAAKNAWKLDRTKIRERAESKFSTEYCAKLYDQWFNDLYYLKNSNGWYHFPEVERTELYGAY